MEQGLDRRSTVLLEFPAVRERLAEATSFGPSRRLAEALEPSSDPVIVARGLDETDQARSLLEERPGVGIGAAHDIGPAIERAARGGRLDPSQFLELAETLDATTRLATSLADERRPLLRELGRELHALPALRSTLARSFDPVGELLDTASPRLGGLRAAVRVAYDRLRRRLDSLVGAELGSALPKNDPPKGDKESWKKLAEAYSSQCKALNEAAEKKDLVGAKHAFGKHRTACMSCHRAHRPQ